MDSTPKVSISVSSSELQAFAVDGRKPTLVDFWAPWCVPCKMMAPLIDTIASEFAGRVTVLKLNVDEEREAAIRYEIRALPTFLQFSQGKVADQVVGVTTRREMVSRIEKLVSANKDTPEGHQLLAITYDEGKLKLVSLLEDGSYSFLDKGNRFHKLVYTFSSDDLSLVRATEEFERMVNDSRLKERDFHAFFETYPDFILSDEYSVAHSQIVLERIAAPSGPLIPDFLLEPFNTQMFCDVLEIKTPGAKFLRLQKNRVRYSDSVMEGVAQLREYQAYFEDTRLRELVHQKYGLTAYKPKLFLIIGRRGKVDPFVLKRLETDLPNVTVRTFDDVLERMRRRIDRLRVP